jgi:hypothetical protein
MTRYRIQKKSKITNTRRPFLLIIIIYYCFALINPNVKGVDVEVLYKEKKTKDKKKEDKMNV